MGPGGRKPPSLRLNRLALSQFRNYASLTWRPDAAITVVTGANGSGKTNLLEAISLLVPGRGLRGARVGEFARRDPVIPDATVPWGVAGRFATLEGEAEIGTGSAPDGPPDRRVFRLDGAAPRNQAAIAERVSAVWLTPQMERLFQDSASRRRRFLDRLVYALEPGHAREVAAHDAAMAQRNRLLAEDRREPAWLAGVEDAIARHAVAATVARAGLVARLNAVLAAGIADPFPAARLDLISAIADRLATEPALAVEDWLRATLAECRARDAAAGTAVVGAHRTDFSLEDAGTGLFAAQASTGQQKALLVGVILGHAGLLTQLRGVAPLLLLDEPAVHLDAQRRGALFDALARLPAQAFLTGTDASAFASLRGRAAGVVVSDGALHPDPGFAA